MKDLLCHCQRDEYSAITVRIYDVMSFLAATYFVDERSRKNRMSEKETEL